MFAFVSLKPNSNPFDAKIFACSFVLLSNRILEEASKAFNVQSVP